MRINSENGLEGPHDDGYSWRKYGQKDILGAKYPRYTKFSSLFYYPLPHLLKEKEKKKKGKEKHYCIHKKTKSFFSIAAQSLHGIPIGTDSKWEHAMWTCVVALRFWNSNIRLFIIAEAITDALSETLKAAGLQSKCKDRMMIHLCLTSRTGENIHAHKEAILLNHHHHRKSKNGNYITRILFLKSNNMLNSSVSSLQLI